MTFRTATILLTTSFVFSCMSLYWVAILMIVYMNFRDF